MLSRDQVLHVARLARLDVTAAELDRYAAELSKVVDWIDKISELGDLADVPPTAHVVALTNQLRADEPHASLPPETALAQAPEPADAGFRVPSPTGSPEH